MIRIASLLLAAFGFAHVFADRASAEAAPAVLVGEVANAEGERLVSDGFSRTLYVFDNDQGMAVPVCVADCAETWPPYTVTADEAKTVKAPLGAIPRANKQLQLTYQGRPLYTFAFDRVKGDDHGDGLGGVWHYIELK